ncbi:MAG: cobalamin-binding protein [Nitrosomonadales bacterium]|nr:MAG: cobalamin-binding protein [Nitrosomonadales bacterium]
MKTWCGAVSLPLIIFLMFLPVLVSAATDTPFILTDDRGRSIFLKHSARRIISLSPNITELVFAAGAGDKLVGVSSYSDYPDVAKFIPEIGDSSSLDLERIVALRPDLVVAWGSGNKVADIDKLERLGLTVFVTEANNLEDIPRLLRKTGKLAGTFAKAELAANVYDVELREIKRHYKNRQPVGVLHLIWYQPLMTVSGSHIISDIINICGGINVFASAPSLTLTISAESLLKTDPQMIISSIPLASSEAGAKELWQRFPNIRAVRDSHLFYVHPDLIHRQTPRMLQAVKIVCTQIEKTRAG